MKTPLFCIRAWINFKTGNVTLEMNRAPTLPDQVDIREALKPFLKRNGAGFFLETNGSRILMVPTPHTRQVVDIDRDFVRDMLHELGLGSDVPVMKKFGEIDTLNQGIKWRFIPIPRGHLSAF